MSAQSIDLKEFFNLKEEVPKQAEKVRSTLAAGKDKIKITTVLWPKLEEKVLEKLTAFFDLKLLDLCVGAWKKYEELQEFSNLKKHPASEENEVALLEHEVTSIHHPSLEITMGKVKLGTIKFDLNISLKLGGAELTIQGGQITKVRLGKCHGEATLEWETAQLLDLKSKNLEFGDAIPLSEPIKIGIA
jgi:hypothetical protein